MAYFGILNPTSTTGVEIAAAGTSVEKARFIAFGWNNDGTTLVALRIFDGTAAAGTERVRIYCGPGSYGYVCVDVAAKSIYPKSWWTAGRAIECNLTAAGSFRVYGEVLREE